MSRLVAIHRSAKDLTIAVSLDGQTIGHISRSKHGLWRNARFVRSKDSRIRGKCLSVIVPHLAKAYGAFPNLVIELHPGYRATIGPDGTPFSRVISVGNKHQLRIFDPHHSETFPTLKEALEAGRYKD